MQIGGGGGGGSEMPVAMCLGHWYCIVCLPNSICLMNAAAAADAVDAVVGTSFNALATNGLRWATTAVVCITHTQTSTFLKCGELTVLLLLLPPKAFHFFSFSSSSFSRSPLSVQNRI